MLLRLCVAAAVCGLLGAGALAAPPNDTCAGAEVIPGSGPFDYLTSVTADVTTATTAGDPADTSCQTSLSRSIWYVFTPGETASYTISSCADAPTGTTLEDTVIAVYTSAGGCGGALTEVVGACDDDSCGVEEFQAVVTTTLEAGTTYYIVVWEFGTTPPPSGHTAVQLRIDRRLLDPPPNDSCAAAEAIPGGGPFPLTTALIPDVTDATALGDPPAPSCQASLSRSVWYAFTPTASGIYTFSSCSDAPTGTTVDDTVLAVYTSAAGCGGPFTEVAGACDNDGCVNESLQAVVTANLTAGTAYFVVLWQAGSVAPVSGNTAVQLRVTQPGPPENDTCAGPVALSLGAPVRGTTALAANDYQLSGSACFTGIGQTASTAPGRDAAYVFTAPDSGLFSFRVTDFASSLNPVLYVAADCAGVTLASCLGASNRSTTGSSEEVMCLPLSGGETVYALVDENAFTAGGTFRIEVDRCLRETEGNDTPSAAGPLACGVQGTISPAGEADFYAIGAPAAGSRVFAVADGVAANSNDFDLRVTTTADTLEYDDQNDDVPFGSLAPNVAGTPLSGAAAFVRVNQFSSIRTAEPYRLYVAVQPPISSATPELEPNDAIGQATSAANAYFSGAISAVGDVDLFEFEAPAGARIVLGLDGDPLRDNTPINGGLALLDASGAALSTVNDGGSTSSTTSGAGSLTSKTPASPGEALAFRAPATGTFYAKVTGASAGDYLLSVAIDCRTLPATDLSVVQAASPDPVFLGGSISYTITIANTGLESAANVILSDALPAGLAFGSATPSQGTCAGTSLVTCTLGDMAAGAQATVVLAGASTAAGTLVNAASVSASTADADPSDDASSSSVSVLDPAADDDGDGVSNSTDCAPLDGGAHAVPVEAPGFAFQDRIHFSWTSLASQAGAGTVYDVMRGSLSDFPVGGASELCLADGVAEASSNDAQVPPAGSGYRYLVRGANACGTGVYGFRSNGAQETSAACP
jgi:uncharacterized repeat protein (TIGR01451 family)